jgi:hypothetical protein
MLSAPTPNWFAASASRDNVAKLTPWAKRPASALAAIARHPAAFPFLDAHLALNYKFRCDKEPVFVGIIDGVSCG